MKIGIDMDEVLCEINEAMILLHNTKYGTTHKKEDVKDFNLEKLYGYSPEEMSKFMNDFFFTDEHANMAPIVGAIEAIETMKEHELVVISARPEHVRDVTEKWLEKHFGDGFLDIHLLGDKQALGGTVRSKADLAQELELDLFIEDSLSNAKKIAEAGIPVILLDRPWNQSEEIENVYRAYSWEEAIDRIKTLV